MRPWRNQYGAISDYFKIYGGIKSLCTSPYPQASIIIGVFLVLFANEKFDASSLTISIIPNLLGFTVGALAITIASSSSEIFILLTEGGDDNSLFMKTMSNFVHFILIQVVVVLLAVLNNAISFRIFIYLNAIMLVYAILTALSTAIQLFQMAKLFNLSKKKKNVTEGNEPLDPV